MYGKLNSRELILSDIILIYQSIFINIIIVILNAKLYTILLIFMIL